jgi:predicted nucleic acid-binding protein
MNALLDSSVLVAAFYEDHEHHRASLKQLLRHKQGQACCAAHSLAEVYATLTAMPGNRRATPAEALLYLGSLRERLSFIALDAGEYASAVELAAASVALSGGVYDALIGQCFLKSRAKWLYTWNPKHFARLAGPIGGRVRQP